MGRAFAKRPTVSPPHRRSQTEAEPRKFRPDVEGLRAVAVVLVVLYHAGVPGLRGGYVGVDVFFVISGFLITGLLLREAGVAGRVSVLGFYARRARRILPAAMATIVATVLAAHWLLNFLQADSIARDGLWTSAFLGNVRFSALGTNYLTASLPPSPLQHLWSLAVEEQFYLVWPLVLSLVVILVRLGRVDHRLRAAVSVALLTLTGASLATSIVQTGTSATAAYYSPFTRAWELGVGAMLAVALPWLRKVPNPLAVSLGWTGLVSIGASAVIFSSQSAFPGYLALLPVLGAGAVLAGGSVAAGGDLRGSVEQLLRRGPMQLCGRLSYSLYLVHFPVLTIAAMRAGHPLSLPQNLLLVAASVLAAGALHYGLENPARRAPLLTGFPLRSVAVGLVLVALTFTTSDLLLGQQAMVTAASAANPVSPTKPAGLASPGSVGHTARVGASAQGASLQQVMAAVSAGAAATRLGPLLVPLASVGSDRSVAYTDKCHSRENDDRSPMCVFGDRAASRTIVLFGDSHATEWLPALTVAADWYHYRVMLMTKSGCPVPTIRMYDTVAKHEYFSCEKFHATALAEIARIHPTLVVAADLYEGADHYGGQAAESYWLSGLRSALHALTRSAGRVALLRDTPNTDTTVVQCVASHPTTLARCDTPIGHAYNTDLETKQERLATSLQVRYVDTTPWLCTPTTCPAVIHDTVAYFDDTHISATYATYLSGVLAAAIGIA